MRFFFSPDVFKHLPYSRNFNIVLWTWNQWAVRLDSTPVRAVSFQTSPLYQQLFHHHDDRLYWNSQQGSGSASSGPTGLTFDLSVSFCCSVVVCSFCNCRACLFLSERGRRLSYRLLRTAISSDHSHTIVYSVGISPVLKRYAGRGVFRSRELLLNGMRSLAAFHSPTCHFLQLCFFTERLRFHSF